MILIYLLFYFATLFTDLLSVLIMLSIYLLYTHFRSMFLLVYYFSPIMLLLHLLPLLLIYELSCLEILDIPYIEKLNITIHSYNFSIFDTRFLVESRRDPFEPVISILSNKVLLHLEYSRFENYPEFSIVEFSDKSIPGAILPPSHRYEMIFQFRLGYHFVICYDVNCRTSPGSLLSDVMLSPVSSSP